MFKLQQVVWNLLSNSVKFTPSQGRIDVIVRRTDSVAEIVVSDTGPGIEPAFRAHVFQRFRQADRGPAKAHGGLGLGLAIVRHLTEAHGGTVTLESGAPSGGATFVVHLPIRAVRKRIESDTENTKSCRPPTLANLRILVVDDVADARELVRFVLEERGASVATAASTGEALDLFVQQSFDVLVADIGMPQRDGYALIGAIRDLPAGRRVRAIALTAYASDADRQAALRAGYDCHVAKPVEPDRLVDAIASLPA